MPEDGTEEDETLQHEENLIRWENVIFIPFNPVFKLLVFVAALLKTYMGPLRAIRARIHCAVKLSTAEQYVLMGYNVYSTLIFALDIILHSAHRQIRETAAREQYKPKPAALILLDCFSLIPFLDMHVKNYCSEPVLIWPHITAFCEFVVIYRVCDYFSLKKCHTLSIYFVGIGVVSFLVINALTCFWFLLTTKGICIDCGRNENFTNIVQDWRKLYVESKADFTVIAFNYVTSMCVGGASSTISAAFLYKLNYTVIQTTMLICIYCAKVMWFAPKMFGEAVLSNIHTFSYRLRLKTIRKVMRTRGIPLKHVKNIENFYKVMWGKRGGTLSVPVILDELPLTLKLEIKEDLYWSVFYHSPTLRRTSASCRRWLSTHIRCEFKMPGDKLHTGYDGHSNLFYVKTGIVQIISSEDEASPILTLTSGTLFGDICFLLPCLNHKVRVECVTYCEIHVLTRSYILQAMTKFPEDREILRARAKERIMHAKNLQHLKLKNKALDRSEAEGIAWIKKRWWQLNMAINEKSIRRGKEDLPPEENAYQCSKYLGQLVLFSESRLFNRSIFFVTDFPFVLAPGSAFAFLWHILIKFTVILVVLLYPPNLRNRGVTPTFSFKVFQFWTDFIFVTDILVGFLTYNKKDENPPPSLIDSAFEQCASWQFVFDLLSTPLLGILVIATGNREYTQICQFSRLFKSHIFFRRTYFDRQDYYSDPLIKVLLKCFFLVSFYLYIGGFFMYLITQYTDLSVQYFFCRFYKVGLNDTDWTPFNIFKFWITTFPRNSCTDTTNMDVYITLMWSTVCFMTLNYASAWAMGSIYIRNRKIVTFQNKLGTLRKEFIYLSIQPQLMNRLNKYFKCQWKSIDCMHNFKDEPYCVRHVIHIRVAEDLIKSCRAFKGADRNLIKELANNVKFMVLPKGTTFFVLGSQCDMVAWTVSGVVNTEYNDQYGRCIQKDYPLGELLSTSSVFFGEIALKTYIASTDCEIFYLSSVQFWDILKRYPEELFFIRDSQRLISVLYKRIVATFIYHNEDLRRFLLNTRRYSVDLNIKLFRPRTDPRLWKRILDSMWIKPNSRYMQYWLAFRATTVIVSIVNLHIQDGIGHAHRLQLSAIDKFCNTVSLIDIIMKLFLGHFNKDGLIIYDKKKILSYYLSRGFFLDLLGFIPWNNVISDIENYEVLIMTFSRCAHLYLVTGYFDYVSNKPNGRYVTLMLFKYQILGVMLVLVCTQMELNRCIRFSWNDNLFFYNITSTKQNNCWFAPNTVLTSSDIQSYYVLAVFHNQLGLVRSMEALGHMAYKRPLLFVVASVVHCFFWFIYVYSVGMLVVYFRGSASFEHRLTQLKAFLIEQRVEKPIIHRVVSHYTYLRARAHGAAESMRDLTDNIGFILRQDIMYYFYRRTLMLLNCVIPMTPQIRRDLSVDSEQMYFLPGEEIIRENDVVPYVFLVNRGHVVISKNKKFVRQLSKGSMFGQIEGYKMRPMKISVTTEEAADILKFTYKRFHDVITDQIRGTIRKVMKDNDYEDYIAVEEDKFKNPYNTIEYLRKGRKIVKFPWMQKPISLRKSKWYQCWLAWNWLIEPTLTCALTLLLLLSMSQQLKFNLMVVLTVFDLTHVTMAVTNYMYALDIEIVRGKCILRNDLENPRKVWGLILELLLLVPPYLGLFTGMYYFMLLKLIRIRKIKSFKKYFCSDYQTGILPVMYRIFVILLSIHVICCSYVKIYCEGKSANKGNADSDNPLENTQFCLFNGDGDKKEVWYRSYIYALCVLLSMQAGRQIKEHGFLAKNGPGRMAFIVLMHYILYIIDLIMTSKILCIVFLKLGNSYMYDYYVRQLVHYLTDAGVTPALLEKVVKYTHQLWDRQRGSWIPALALEAPQCICEDIMCSLYLHHLHRPPIFRNLPHYFLRQLATKFHRIVIFPDNHVVQAGDLISNTYFINEGEIDKYYFDKTGEKVLMGTLTANGYFGIIPGIFPGSPYHCSYLTRTVVDLVYLRNEEWQSLLSSYPNVYAMMKKIACDYASQIGIQATFKVF